MRQHGFFARGSRGIFDVSRTWHLPAYPPVENLRWMWLAWIVEKHLWLQVHLVLRRIVEVVFFWKERCWTFEDLGKSEGRVMFLSWFVF